MKKKWIAYIAVVTIIISRCLKESDSTMQNCSYDPCAYKAPASEIADVMQYLDSVQITATQHCSGLFYKIDDAGSGQSADACSGVYVQYKGQLTNGFVFDSTRATDSVGLYLNQVISGWSKGVPLIKEGGRIHPYIPPSLAYGNQPPSSTIPPNSILVFDVKLLKVVF